ncbi:MAG: arylsulfatase [Verrucomicrobiales bacterium]|nr:arylsulfatase [Verrucomicrobiales bacterium]|tara:strand:+ start:4862 stop:6226 length:1365 start_codon:yes stop_codon:yes gene_type:complete
MLKGLFSKKKETVPPNVLIVVADDLGYGDLGCYGAVGFETARLDQLAADGVRFTSYYSGGVNCTGGRAALLTGCYPNRIGMGGRSFPPGGFTGLNPEERNLATMLAEAGYVSGYVGKWTLGSHPHFLPNNQGFDYWFGIPFSHSFLDQEVEDAIYLTSSLPLMDDENELEEDTDPAFLTRRCTEQAAEFMESAGDNPFCLVVSHAMPHRPLALTEEFDGRSKYGIYGDVIEEIDWSVGALVDVLAVLEKLENTIIIFTSDNGPALQSEEVLGYRSGTPRPYRGGKGQTLEGGVRVPCIVNWPARIPGGQVSDEMVCGMDWLPTIAGLAGVELKRTPEIDGVDIFNHINGEKPPEEPVREEVYYYRDNRLQAVRQGPWKLHVYRGDWDVEKPEKSDYMLFNLDSDTTEESNLADQNPELIDELAKVADRARRELGDSVHGRRGRSTRKAGEVSMG